eukprot:Blabericola_migrator_1__1212@NODE_130_length_13282_cov_126_272191_g115_i0_p9_GENE_NODE_130_length_13282_cov_126_272191_g115_i0NODE_130_length_13282_cov_126_272191_g115_i0_p9_ORF_typecomplete_len110_score6_61_NODE_130_length_13282_cov_126_272191_g115_i094779806
MRKIQLCRRRLRFMQYGRACCQLEISSAHVLFCVFIHKLPRKRDHQIALGGWGIQIQHEKATLPPVLGCVKAVSPQRTVQALQRQGHLKTIQTTDKKFVGCSYHLSQME